VNEPTAARGRDVVWFTGNSSVAYSLDRGRSFTILDPSTVLPDAGLGFCCDQEVAYSPSANLFVWLSQYWCTVVPPAGHHGLPHAGHRIEPPAHRRRQP